MPPDDSARAGAKPLPPGALRFIEALKKVGEGNEKLVGAVDALFDVIGQKDDGLISAMDDLRDANLALAQSNNKLTEQILGIREDIRRIAATRGLAQFFDLLR